MKKFVKANMNDRIKVILTDHGRELHKKHHEDLFKDQTIEIKYEDIREDPKTGESEWLMWEFMQIFGKHLGNGFKMVVKNTNIQIEVKE